jgi:tRNA dimethylallyltransferase
MGPTASGKTKVAVDLVAQAPFDIISVDSAMVYRGLDIGTAKPSVDILKEAPHRLIDICDPENSYSAGQFVQDASEEIATIHALGRIPLLVGGTGLYFRSLEAGFSELPGSDPVIRSRLEEEACQKGWEYMYTRLAEIDPQSTMRIHRNDPQRIARALEIYELTGTPPSVLYAQGRNAVLRQPIIKVIIAPKERKTLHDTIESRFLQMLEAGFVEEVAELRDRGNLDQGMPSMRLVGYRQIWSYLNADIDYNTMIKKGIVATRQLAKRQLTWFRSEQNAFWVDSDTPELSQFLLNYLKNNPFCSDCL